MGYPDYRPGFKKRGLQHNIMAFVGNGFDLQVADSYHQLINTRYTSFFHFLEMTSFSKSNKDDPVFVKMGELRDCGDRNWSDVEAVVANMQATREATSDQLVKSLRKLQNAFSEFLTLAVPNSLLVKLGMDSVDDQAAVASLSKFGACQIVCVNG